MFAAPQRALDLFSQSYNCAQSVYAASGKGNLTTAQRLSLAAPFGGGVARHGEVCGALTGALMALGEAAEAALAADPEGARHTLYEQSAQLLEAFRQRFGAIRCHDLTGCDFNHPEEKEDFQQSGKRESVCCRVVAFAAEKAASVISIASAPDPDLR